MRYRRLILLVTLVLVSACLTGCGGGGNGPPGAAGPPTGMPAGAIAEFTLEIDPGAQEITQVSPSAGEVRTQEDVTGKVRPRIQGIDWRPLDKQIAFDVALKNCSTDETFYAPMRAVVEWMRPSGAQVLNPDGEIDGRPYWDYSDALGDQALDPQETSEPRRWEIYSPLWGIVLLCVRVEAELEPPLTGRIVFTSNRDGSRQLYLMNADGSGQTKLTDTPWGNEDGAVSPDGTEIAFSTTQWSEYADLVLRDLAGGPVTRLTTEYFYDNGPAWSPDGTKIAWAHFRYPNRYDIWVMDRDGTAKKQLTDVAGDDTRATWSPDGSMIAFASERDGDFEIYLMDPNTGAILDKVTDNTDPDYNPAWSPDGSKIAFETRRDGDPEIYVVNVDHSGLTRLTHNPAWDELPDWSPDGTMLAFDSDRDYATPGSHPHNPHEIYVMRADGSHQTRITHNEEDDFVACWFAG